MNKGNEPARKALGKGLSALLPSRAAAPAASPTPVPVVKADKPLETLPDGLLQVNLDAIRPSSVQPRSVFDSERLNELAQSIRANGLIQPLIVQRTGDEYQLIAGERRWRAARLAGLQNVPVVIQDHAPERLLEIALIENIQREDLNPIEVAKALDRLAREHKLSHEEIASRTGKDRTTVTNLLRLLRLDHDIQLLVAEGRLSMGHARAILGLSSGDQQKEVAERAAAQGLSVRQVERLVKDMTERRDPGSKGEAETESRPDPNVLAAVSELESVLGTRVRIVSSSPNRGRIEIEYYSFDDLDRIYSQITGKDQLGGD